MEGNYSPAVGPDSILPESYHDNYEGKLLVLRPEALKEEYRFEEFQYFLGQSGFGCDPSKLGTKVFGRFLIDGEETSFHRGAFMGVADEKKLPEWAKVKLMQWISPNTETMATQEISM